MLAARILIWIRSSNSHTGPRLIAAPEAGQMAASDYVLIFIRIRLHLGGVHR